MEKVPMSKFVLIDEQPVVFTHDLTQYLKDDLMAGNVYYGDIRMVGPEVVENCYVC